MTLGKDIERVVQETGASFDDGEHILYVNGQCRRPEEMNNAVLAKNVRYYKDDQEGVDYMCRISEEIWNDGKAEGKAEGRTEGRAEDVKALMESLNISFVQACNSLKFLRAIERLLKNCSISPNKKAPLRRGFFLCSDLGIQR